jgi:hypothetical protein
MLGRVALVLNVLTNHGWQQTLPSITSTFPSLTLQITKNISGIFLNKHQTERHIMLMLVLRNPYG